jgi:hypothetical protein
MRDDLVTAAVFGDHTQAVAARLHLEAAGVPAFLADENVAGGIFSLGTAVGGIKLQVPESRLEETLRLLDEQMPAGGGATDWSEVDVGRPDDEEPAADEPAARPTPSSAKPPSEAPPEGDLTLRERVADGLPRAFVFGILFAPFMLLVAWRVVQVWSTDERLGPPYRRKAQLATALLFGGSVALAGACCLIRR